MRLGEYHKATHTPIHIHPPLFVRELMSSFKSVRCVILQAGCQSKLPILLYCPCVSSDTPPAVPLPEGLRVALRGHLPLQRRDTLHKRTLQPPSLFKYDPQEDPHHKQRRRSPRVGDYLQSTLRGSIRPSIGGIETELFVSRGQEILTRGRTHSSGHFGANTASHTSRFRSCLSERSASSLSQSEGIQSASAAEYQAGCRRVSSRSTDTVDSSALFMGRRGPMRWPLTEGWISTVPNFTGAGGRLTPPTTAY
ncbi:hypothetical protein NQZ68_002529, partial [Dissostichus eleginoides]